MSTYANIKMIEIYVLYGNPFSRKNWKKNLIQSLFTKYYKRIDFTQFSKTLNYSKIKITNSIFNNHYKRSSLFLNSSHTEILSHNKNQSIISSFGCKKLNHIFKEEYLNSENEKNLKLNFKNSYEEKQNNLNFDENPIFIVKRNKSLKTETTSYNTKTKIKNILNTNKESN